MRFCVTFIVLIIFSILNATAMDVQKQESEQTVSVPRFSFYKYEHKPVFVLMGGSCSGKSYSINLAKRWFPNEVIGSFDDSYMRRSMLDELGHVINLDGVFPDLYPSTITEVVECLLESNYFCNKLRRYFYGRYDSKSLEKIIASYRRYTSSADFLNDVRARLVINKVKKQPVFVDHIHTQNHLMAFKAASEFNLYKLNIVPIFLFTDLNRIIDRIFLRFTNVMRNTAKPDELRITATPYLEFFKNMEQSTDISERTLDTLRKEDIKTKIHKIRREEKFQLSQITNFCKEINSFYEKQDELIENAIDLFFRGREEVFVEINKFLEVKVIRNSEDFIKIVASVLGINHD